MRILLSKPAQAVIQNMASSSKIAVRKLLSRLESINTSNIDSDTSIRRVTGADEDIYVMRIGSVRVFLMKKDADIVLLSIENG